MKQMPDRRTTRLFVFLIIVMAPFISPGASFVFAQSVLRIYVGGQQRPDILREIADGYTKANPGIRVEVETGGTTPEAQQQYLNTALAAKDPTLDLVLLDSIRPAQWLAAHWIEPLDSYLGVEKDAIMARYFPALRDAGLVSGKVVALPYFADAQFLFYRKDLLEKYALPPPKTWQDLKLAAQKILENEKSPNLRGFATAGAPIEGAVCSYLVPLWGAGETFLKEGKLNLTGPEAKKPFELWADLKAAKVAPANLSEIATDRIRQDFQAGNLIFAMSWSYVWSRAQGEAESAVKGRIGVVAPPGFTAELPASCVGGWQVALTSFSRNKVEAVKLARYLSSPEAAKILAISAGHLPVFASVYDDRDVLAANPWFSEALPALLAAKARPSSPRYPEISEIIRTNVHAVLAGTKTVEAALADMNARLGLIYR